MDDDMDAKRRREECERKARRGEMDPRLEFVFQLLMDGTQQPRHQIMDHIFEGDMVNTDKNKSQRHNWDLLNEREKCKIWAKHLLLKKTNGFNPVCFGG